MHMAANAKSYRERTLRTLSKSLFTIVLKIIQTTSSSIVNYILLKINLT